MGRGRLILALLATAGSVPAGGQSPPAEPPPALTIVPALPPALAPTPAPAQPAAAFRLDAFERAMAESDYVRAAAILQPALAARSRVPGARPPEPLLNGLVGRLLLVGGESGSALAYLNRAAGAEIPPAQRIAAGLARAEALALRGDYRGAAAALAGLQAERLDAAQSRRLVLARARAMVGDDPRAALADARALLAGADASAAAARWEAELLAAQALSLLGDKAGAGAAAGRAWVASADAPAADVGPLRVALMRAALASDAGDRDALLAMLNLAGAPLNRIDGQASEYLPVCGDEGVTPADHVTFGIYNAAAGRHLVPLGASRPEVVAAFLDALAGRELMAEPEVATGGYVFTARCRARPSMEYDKVNRGADPWTEWFAGRGLYFDISGEGTLEDINRLSAEIEELARAQGEDAPALIPMRYQLWQWLETRARDEEDVEEWQIADLRRKVSAAMERLGGAEGLMPGAREEAEDKRMEAALSPAEGFALFRAAMSRRIGILPLDAAYTTAIEWFAMDTDLPAATRKTVVEGLLARFESMTKDKRRRALLVRLAELQQAESDLRGARRSFRAARVPDDICLTMDQDPAVESHTISDEAYPKDALIHDVQGLTVIEMEVDAGGRVAASRVVLSSPPALFEPVFADLLPGFRFSPPRTAGRARSCRGILQRVIWRLPPKPEGVPEPRFRPPDGRAT